MFKVHRVPIKRVLNCSRKSKYIYNQRTLLGVLCGLMANQKIEICVSRIKDSDGNMKITPFGFKINAESIPTDLVPCKIHANNLLNLEIEGAKPILAMVVCYGDDSQEVKLSYSMFIDSIRDKVSSFEPKISRWFTSNKIVVTKSDSKSLIPMDEETFETFIRRIEIFNRRENAKPAQSKLFPQVASTVVDLSNDSSSTQDDSSDSEDYEYKRKPNKQNLDEPSTSKGIFQKKRLQNSMEKLKSICSSSELVPSTRSFYCETVNILDFLIKINESFQNIEFYQSFTSENDGLRFIPEIDDTRQENSGITYIEGVLPLKTKSYQLAMRMKPANNAELDSGAACILSNLIRFAFPSHWIENVTLRGSGGRTSLINIWNHVDPLKLPLKEPKDVLLGETRFRALLDHVVRKSGRKTYDKAVERILVSTLSKAMHYTRSKLNIGKKSFKSESVFDYKDEKSNEEFQIPNDYFQKPDESKFKLRTTQQDKDIFDVMDDSVVENNDEEENIVRPNRSKNQRIDDNEPSSQESVGRKKSAAKTDESEKIQESADQSNSGFDGKLSDPSRILQDKNLEENEGESSGFVDPSQISSDTHSEFSPLKKSTPLKVGNSERKESNFKRTLENIGESTVKKSKKDDENSSEKESTSTDGFLCSFKIHPVLSGYGNEIPSSQPVNPRMWRRLVDSPNKTPPKTHTKTSMESPIKTPIRSPAKSPVKSPSNKQGQSSEEKYKKAVELLKKKNLLDKFFAEAGLTEDD